MAVPTCSTNEIELFPCKALLPATYVVYANILGLTIPCASTFGGT